MLGFLWWQKELKMTEIRKRITHGLMQQTAARRQLVRNFRDAMNTYNCARSRHDKDVRGAKKAKLAAEARTKL